MRKGFTLVEIMIVVAIIALLAAIAIPNLLRARLNANDAAAKASLQALVTAIESYAASALNISMRVLSERLSTAILLPMIPATGAQQDIQYPLMPLIVMYPALKIIQSPQVMSGQRAAVERINNN